MLLEQPVYYNFKPISFKLPNKIRENCNHSDFQNRICWCYKKRKRNELQNMPDRSVFLPFFNSRNPYKYIPVVSLYIFSISRWSDALLQQGKILLHCIRPEKRQRLCFPYVPQLLQIWRRGYELVDILCVDQRNRIVNFCLKSNKLADQKNGYANIPTN